MPLPLYVPECDLWDPKAEEFITTKPAHLLMEHSLISISKWETKWKVPFIEGPNPKSREKSEEMWLDYFRCMVISPKDPDPMIFRALPTSARNKIIQYINDPSTASSVREDKRSPGTPEQVTSELVYFWMINYGIPDSFDRWHFNRLMMLIRICQRKMSSSNPSGGKKNGGFNRGGAQSIENARISAARRAAAAKRRK